MLATLSVSSILIFPLGPFVEPSSYYLAKPVRSYFPKLNRNLIGIENRKRTVIYQWINLINGSIYVGSAWNGSERLLSYWRQSVLNRNLPIYKSIEKYGHNNFSLIILEDLGSTGSVSKIFIFEREQYYLDILFSQSSTLKLNLSPTAGTNLGYKHSENFKLNRTGSLNPMYGRILSPEFKFMQNRDKSGANNPQFGVKKSLETVAKITKLIHVYDFYTMEFIGVYPTVVCKKEFKIGYDTLKKYLNSQKPYKNKLFSLKKLH